MEKTSDLNCDFFDFKSFPFKRETTLKWDYPISNNASVIKTKFHMCGICDCPVIIYGRLLPCKHSFCFDCVNNLKDHFCFQCNSLITLVEKVTFDKIHICQEIIQAKICNLSYLSKEDLNIFCKHSNETNTDEKPLKSILTETSKNIETEKAKNNSKSKNPPIQPFDNQARKLDINKDLKSESGVSITKLSQNYKRTMTHSYMVVSSKDTTNLHSTPSLQKLNMTPATKPSIAPSNYNKPISSIFHKQANPKTSESSINSYKPLDTKTLANISSSLNMPPPPIPFLFSNTNVNCPGMKSLVDTTTLHHQQTPSSSSHIPQSLLPVPPDSKHNMILSSTPNVSSNVILCVPPPPPIVSMLGKSTTTPSPLASPETMANIDPAALLLLNFSSGGRHSKTLKDSANSNSLAPKFGMQSKPYTSHSTGSTHNIVVSSLMMVPPPPPPTSFGFSSTPQQGTLNFISPNISNQNTPRN